MRSGGVLGVDVYAGATASGDNHVLLESQKLQAPALCDASRRPLALHQKRPRNRAQRRTSALPQSDSTNDEIDPDAVAALIVGGSAGAGRLGDLRVAGATLSSSLVIETAGSDGCPGMRRSDAFLILAARRCRRPRRQSTRRFGQAQVAVGRPLPCYDDVWRFQLVLLFGLSTLRAELTYAGASQSLTSSQAAPSFLRAGSGSNGGSDSRKCHS
jgi:hypothetical protein